jgi:hypothetical protein
MKMNHSISQSSEYNSRSWLRPLTATAVGLLVLTACDKGANVKIDLSGCHKEYTMQPGDGSFYDIAARAVGNKKGTNNDVVAATANAIEDARATIEGISKADAATLIFEPSKKLELPTSSRIGTPVNC